MKRIMILGGGTCQLSAFHKAKALGLETVLADMLDSAPGTALADYYVPASTFDPEACQRGAMEYHVDGIMTLGTDQPVLTAALMKHVMDEDRVSEVDYLSGDDAYKRDWMAQRRERVGLVAFDPHSPRGLLAAARHFAGVWIRR